MAKLKGEALVAFNARMAAGRAAKNGWPTPPTPAGSVAVSDGRTIKVNHATSPEQAPLHEGGKPHMPVLRTVQPKPQKHFYQNGKVLFYSISPSLTICISRSWKEDIQTDKGRWKEKKCGKSRDVKFVNHRYWANPEDVPLIRGDEDGPHQYYGVLYMEALPLEWTSPVPDELKPKYAWIRSISEMLADPHQKTAIKGFFEKIEEKDNGVDGMTIMQEVARAEAAFLAEQEAAEAQMSMPTAMA